VLLATVALLVLSTASGGYFASAWYAAALFLLALLAVTLVVLGVPRETPRLVLAALALFACFTLFAYASIAWASQAGAAWDGANRDCLYLIVLALFSLWPVGPGGLRALLGLVGAALALLGLVELLRMALAADPTGFFIGARLAEPAGYINANAALWTLGLLPCVGLASARELAPPPPLRGLAMAGATLLAGLALMSQSRGWLLTVPFGALALLALSPGRLRTLGSLVLVTAATAAVSGPLLAVHDHFRPGRLGSLVDDAVLALLLAALVAGVLAMAFGFADRRVRLSPAATRRVGIGVAALAALVVAAGLLAVAAADTGPVDRVSKAWRDFKHGGEPPRAGQARLSAVATNRYDFWRLGWKLGREHPLKGIGAENYQEEYLAHGHSSEQPRYTHSLELEAFSQLGIPGLLLLLGALGAAVAAALRARATAALPVAACLGTFVYWLLHASLDWLWEIPAVTGLALALLAAAAGSASAPRATAGGVGRVAAAAGLLAFLAVAVSLVLPWVAELDVRSASRNWPSDPAGAQARLDRAERLNPLSPQAQLTSATISLRLGRNQAAARSFRDALKREPRNIYAIFELGLIEADQGRRVLARRTLQRALRLSPRDVFNQAVLGDLRAGRKIRIKEVNQRLLARARLFNR
jgi:tetratricopeptide (TPR) repeat protein